jgi:hypothetical protein
MDDSTPKTGRPPRIWVDADACPRGVKDLVCRAAERTQVDAVFVANQAIPCGRSPRVSGVQVAGGPDVADDHIVSAVVADDLVVTADIPLAARLVPLGAVVLDPRGHLYDEDNARERLSIRDFMADVREAGVTTDGPRAFGPRDKARFANALDRALERLRQRRPAGK